MKISTVFTLTILSLLLNGCKQEQDYDASGHFEADEVIVSAEQNGNLLSYKIHEGALFSAGDTVGQIDAHLEELQKEQIQASIQALQKKTISPNEQITLIRRQLDLQKSQLAQQTHEQKRMENLVKADAATQKQLDDLNASLDQLRKQIEVTKQQLNLHQYNIQAQNRSVLSEKGPLEKSVAQIQDQIDKAYIINPIKGVVLNNYALQGELQILGKPLYKIANTDTLFLRAYITGTQLPQIKLGQTVTVRIDKGEKAYKNYSGKITWISNKAEFSPKTIQTKDERASLVYAIKVKVINDSYLKIGMYAEVLFTK